MAGKIYNISGDTTEHIDIQKLPIYTREYRLGNTITVYGYVVEIPDEPEDEYCVNLGIAQNDQYYRRTWVPDDLQYWKEDVKEEFIQREYHRRKEGLWYFINGVKVYFPGICYWFLRYWMMQTGKLPLFRMSDLDFFLLWTYVVRSPTIYGLVVFKCRRLGDTEKALCIIYEYASRVKNTINGMQDCRKEDEIEKTYQRLTFAHENMIWFMKPINRGTTNPKANLELKMPESKITMKSQLKLNSKQMGDEVEFEFKALGSEINYYVSTEDATDGKRHGRFYCDEFGKPKKLNPIEGWRYTKKTLVDEIYETLSGKALYTSTVEEETKKTTEKGESKYLEIAQEMWDDADPDNLSETGETTSGMIRVVRGALERGRPDRFGYTNKEALLEKIEADKRHLIKQKKWKKLVEYQRQNCVDISDIFTSMTGDSSFNIENLAQREIRLRYEIKPAKAVRGNFEWKDGKKPTKENKHEIEVIWVPNSNGRWLVSGHPKDWNLQANAKNDFSHNPKPKNTHAFCCGIDPVAQKDVLDKKNRSLAGLVIKRKLDPLIDGDKFDSEGEPEFGGEYFSTNRIVCTYLWRWEEPTDNYEDWLMSLIYFGSDFLIEKNHSAGFQQYLEGIKFHGYYMAPDTTLKNVTGQSEQWGISANEKTIDLYFSYLATLTNKWHNTIDHPNVIDQLKSMNYENKGKKDLGVATGICEVASQRQSSKKADRKEDKTVYFPEYTV